MYGCRSGKKFITLYCWISSTISLVGFKKWLIDILTIIHYNKDYNKYINAGSSWNVHHIHYNKDYNLWSSVDATICGVHHIHYNKGVCKMSRGLPVSVALYFYK